MRDVITHFPGSGLPRGCSWFASQDLLVRNPGQISRLLDVRFTVIQPWPVPGDRAEDGQTALDYWPVGVCGVVTALKFDTCLGWQVQLEHDADHLPASLRWIEVRLEHFLHCTEPLNGPVGQGLPPEAANDA
jgi:hypothetical protein